MHWVTAHPRVSPRVPSQSSDLRSPTWVTLPQRLGTQNIRALGSMATRPHVQREWRGAWSSAQHWGGLIGVIQYPHHPSPCQVCTDPPGDPSVTPSSAGLQCRGMVTPQPHSALWGQSASQPSAAQRGPAGLCPFGTAQELGGPRNGVTTRTRPSVLGGCVGMSCRTHLAQGERSWECGCGQGRDEGLPGGRGAAGGTGRVGCSEGQVHGVQVECRRVHRVQVGCRWGAEAAGPVQGVQADGVGGAAGSVQGVQGQRARCRQDSPLPAVPLRCHN